MNRKVIAQKSMLSWPATLALVALVVSVALFALLNHGWGDGQEAAPEAASSPVQPTTSPLADGALPGENAPPAESPEELPDDEMVLADQLILGRSFAHRMVSESPHAREIEAALANAEESQTSELSVVKQVETGTSDGEGKYVYNGSFLTYTISITNNSNRMMNDLLLIDPVARGALDTNNITCNGCEKAYSKVEARDQFGAIMVLTVTHTLTWKVNRIGAGETRRYAFTARVVGQSEGASVTNQAQVLYDNQSQLLSSNEVQTPIRVRIEKPGEASLSPAANWSSIDLGGTLSHLGGTLSQDWADFDHNSYLDLALASSSGVTVYRNQDGRLRRLWTSDRPAYGVQWADFTGDGRPELIAVGETSNMRPEEKGTNYIFEHNPDPRAPADDRFQLIGTFDAELQLVRVEVGDFTGDGHPDIIASTNSINADCPVVLYQHPGSYDPDATIKFNWNSHDYCLSREASASLALGDHNNNGRLDLALGLFETQSVVLLKNTPELIAKLDEGKMPDRQSDFITIDNSTFFLPYDFAWGDFTGNGYLDLAAAFPFTREVRVYRNVARSGARAFQPVPQPIRTLRFRTPLAIDAADFTGDGKLELAVADSPPLVYRYTGQQFSAIEAMRLPPDAIGGQLWSVRAVDTDNSGSPDLALTNLDGPSMLFTNFAPMLDSRMTVVDQESAASVAWADVNGDDLLDLMFGAGAGQSGLFRGRLYQNTGSDFVCEQNCDYRRVVGPHQVAFADVTGDFNMDLTVGNRVEDGIYQVQEARLLWTSSDSRVTRAVAWGDVDGDGLLDLLTGYEDGGVELFLNTDSGLSQDPIIVAEQQGNITDIAWGDFNNDGYLDFALGSNGSPVRVYRNLGSSRFELAWTSRTALKTTAVAWADADGNGYLDLAVGNRGARNHIYLSRLRRSSSNDEPPFDTSPNWVSNEKRNTTSLAWGDWNSNGRPDLAVGNAGQWDQIYANLSSKPGWLRLEWLWKSKSALPTTDLAWGDFDGDGDLDLAVSQGADNRNGYYENNYISLTHRDAAAARLPVDAPYLRIARPGLTNEGYFYSSAEILSGPVNPAVEIAYTVYDPMAGRAAAGTRSQVVDAKYFYSTDGGGTWKRATEAATENADKLSPPATVAQSGSEFKFYWDAQKDQAISDNVLFRIELLFANPSGRKHRAATAAVSPPFRTRGTTCHWPEDATISLQPVPVEPNEPVTFFGNVARGDGEGGLTFHWTFREVGTENMEEKTGQIIKYTFVRERKYEVHLKVTGPACPITRPATTTRIVTVGSGNAHYLHLPLVHTQNASTATSQRHVARTQQPAPPAPAASGQVTALRGTVDAGTGTTSLIWTPVTEDDGLTGYRIYRRARSGDGPFEPLATVPPATRQYRDRTSHCGRIYYITPLWEGGGESPPSARSFYAPACEE